MGKALRVFVILIFLLSVAALTLGCLLFLKRELLKARTQRLEDRLIAIGAYIEEVPGKLEPKPDDPSRDISECEALAVENPDRSPFWTTYKYNLESAEPEKMVNLADHKQELMTLYKRDIEGKIIKDAQGFRVMEGPGTMKDLLDEFQTKVEAQYDLLNETRQQLTDLRNEYVNCIEELNNRKAFLRERLLEIVDLKNTIRQLEGKIRDLESEIVDLKSQIRDLNDQIADLNREIQRLQDIIQDRDNTIEQLNVNITNLEVKLEQALQKRIVVRDVPMTPGTKGHVLQANEKWMFVSVELTDECMNELYAKEKNIKVQDPVGFEMYVERPSKDGGPPTFVTKIALKWVNRKENTAIFDILPGWTQVPIKPGDVVYRHKSQEGAMF